MRQIIIANAPKSITQIQETADTLNMVFGDMEAKLTEIINEITDEDSVYFQYACHIRRAVRAAKEEFIDMMHK